MSDIEDLPNLGPASAAWLRAAGIATQAELRRLGPVVAYRQVQRRQQKATLNLLWAMVAGLAGKHWKNLTAAEKEHWLKELRKDDPPPPSRGT